MTIQHHTNCVIGHKECDVYIHEVWRMDNNNKLERRPVHVHRSTYRNAHRYSVYSDPQLSHGIEMSGVTTINNELSGSPEGLMWWASGLAAATGNPNEYKEDRNRSAESGSELHSDIENYINNGTVNEMNPMFLAWYNEVGNVTNFVESEIMLYHTEYKFGGTADALSLSGDSNHILWDWKTKKSSSYDGKPILKEWAQIAAYWKALKSMNSIYQPDCAKIAYVMRDTNEVDVVTISRENLEIAFDVFYSAIHMRDKKSLFTEKTKPPKKGRKNG